MHPYDRWGFSQMTQEEDDLYWSYVLARFSAYRNVWWSLANEYDLMYCKTVDDWERYAVKRTPTIISAPYITVIVFMITGIPG